MKHSSEQTIGREKLESQYTIVKRQVVERNILVVSDVLLSSCSETCELDFSVYSIG